jgi:hypothetical protein
MTGSCSVPLCMEHGQLPSPSHHAKSTEDDRATGTRKHEGSGLDLAAARVF